MTTPNELRTQANALIAQADAIETSEANAVTPVVHDVERTVDSMGNLVRVTENNAVSLFTVLKTEIYKLASVGGIVVGATGAAGGQSKSLAIISGVVLAAHAIAERL
jgi:hypothetical protein